MEKGRRSLFTVSQFAQMCGVSRQTLIYYDREGIFSPQVVGENGYRYYSHLQYDELETILTMRDLGAPLAEIRSRLLEGEEGGLLPLLEEEERHLNREIERLEYLRESVRRKRQLALLAQSHPPFSPWVERRGPRHFLLEPFSAPITPASYAQTAAVLSRYCRAHQYGQGNSSGAGVSRERLEAGDYFSASYYAMEHPAPTGDEKEHLEPAGRWAIIHHRGYYDSAWESYGLLLSYIAREGLQIASGSYESRLLSADSTRDPERYLTRIEIRVE